jgi:haloalkane dehalogenase
MASKQCGKGDYAFVLKPYQRLYPFKGSWYRNNGLCQHYVDVGRGNPMVMVHGNPTWSFYYRKLMERFLKEYRVITPDHIGMGRSEKPDDSEYEFTLKRRIDDLERLMKNLGIEKNVTLVVHDWGGYIGLGWALRKPSRISRIVILNTAAFRMPRGMKLPWELWVVKNVPGISDISVKGFNAFAGLATKRAVQNPMPENVKRAYLAPYNNWKNRLAVLRFVQDIALKPSDRSYKEFKWIDRNLGQLKEKPMLICWGMKDFVFNKRILREWTDRFPRAKVKRFKDGGHYVLEDKPKEIISEMEEFFKSCASKTHASLERSSKNKNPIGGKKR